LIRVDKLLWFLRLAKTRAIARTIAADGHMRVNGRRIDRAHQKIVVGDILSIPLGNISRVIELTGLPERRGPASEAQSCYRVLDGTSGFPIAATNRNQFEKGNLQP